MDQKDCGPTCLRIIASYYGKNLSTELLYRKSEINRNGVNMFNLAHAAEKIGFHARGASISLDDLRKTPLPCILHWSGKHFIVLLESTRKYFLVADPAKGIIKYSSAELSYQWVRENNAGIALLLEPTADFGSLISDEIPPKTNFIKFYSHILRYKKLLLQLGLSFLIGSFLQLLLPFLAQSIVDVGIPSQDIGLINLILLAQFILLVSKTSVDFIRSWILLHISTRLNIFILTDFFSKLLRLPINFFDTKKTGDILQRIEDQRRIETFLTGQTLTVAFSLFTLLVFSIVLALYDVRIFLIFAIGSLLYTTWIFAFLSKRKQLDYKRFDISSKTQSVTVQMIQGMQEIKISGTERKKRWQWEHLQAKLFHLNVKSLALGQYQMAGSLFFNEGKNLLIIFIVAKAVISGELTLGSMVAIQYIMGQLNSPIEQFLGFVQSYQDAKLSMDRLNELFKLEAEEKTDHEYVKRMPLFDSIRFKDVTFNYPGNEPIFNNLNLNIESGKVTAIVGLSGSGKTTLIKLLLGFYSLTHGKILIGDVSLDRFSPRFWRDHCGVVLQDSFIFSDTIAANIALSEKSIDYDLLDKSIKLACLREFIESLPFGLNTLIGAEGNGISQGQRQRILIARAIYKQPEILLFDEATNALDATNERLIVSNLSEVFKGRTVIIVAHRLSTVKHADKILVLEKGTVAELGTHNELIAMQSRYFNLVKNQLELGK